MADESQLPQSPQALDGQPQVGGTPPPVSSNDIQSMPENFYEGSGGGEGGGGGRMRRILIIAIIVVVVLGLILLGYVLFQQFFNGTNENTNEDLVINTTVTNTANANTNAVANVNDGLVGNTNVVVNTNAVLNVNTNSNTNTVTNDNTNTVSNLNANSNTNTNTNTSQTLTKLPSTTDGDGDGLTDIEESLYGTAADQPDSDGDGFIDGKQVLVSGESTGEVYLGYNPRGTGRLDVSGLVRTYTSTQKQYSILYPNTWLAQPTNSTEANVLFTPSESTGEYIQIGVQSNPAQMTAEQWYLSLNPSISASELTDVSINGLVGVLSPDESTVYLAKGSNMYVMSYSTGALEELNYWTTFEMMYLNFRLTETSGTNANTNS
ncbi:MAG: hypothetical protein WCV86_00500 [Patescibacteria group bacterium]|jgi:hypothetical protein